MKFNKKVIIITGASSGIGAATAQSFAKEGAITVLVSRTESKLLEVAQSIQEAGGTAFVAPADVSQQEQLQAMVERVVNKFGRIDILFNNAGTSYVGEVKDQDFVPHLKQMIQTDFLGTVYCTKAVLPVMQQQGKGHILNMSSVVGKKAFAKFTGYSSVMHAISGFTDGLRQELRDTNIGVSIIHPGLTQTALLNHVEAHKMPAPFKAMTPITPEQVAEAVLNGIARKKAKIVVPFQPRVLMFLNAISIELGDKFVQLISRPSISKLLGMYKGSLYHDAVVKGHQ